MLRDHTPQILLQRPALPPTLPSPYSPALTCVSSSGWVPNTSLQELSPEAASAAINDKMRKDLQSAYELASEGHDLDFYKELLQQFQEELVAKEEAQKAKKKRASAVDEMDIDAVDKTPAKKSKKRKAEDETVVSFDLNPPPSFPPKKNTKKYQKPSSIESSHLAFFLKLAN